MTATEVTRETLDGTPVRVLTFLRAIGTSLSIRRLMASKGYTPADQKEGWALLHKVSGLFDADSPEETDVSVRDAINTIDNSDEDLYRLVRSGLTRLHPDQAAFTLGGLAPATGTASVLAMKNLLDRIDTLEKGRSKETAKADKAAIATLEQRGVTAAERARFRKLVEVAESASEVAQPEDTSASDEQLVKDLIALRAWFEDWSEVARVAVKRKDYLIRLGLASRKASKKEDPAPLDSVLPTPPASFRRGQRGHRRARRASDTPRAAIDAPGNPSALAPEPSAPGAAGAQSMTAASPGSPRVPLAEASARASRRGGRIPRAGGHERGAVVHRVVRPRGVAAPRGGSGVGLAASLSLVLGFHF